MKFTAFVFVCVLLASSTARAQTPPSSIPPSFDYDVAQAHEIKPHRRTIPLVGVRPGFNQLRLRLIVSTTGDVLDAEAGGDSASLRHWPEVRSEVRQWKFRPFEENGEPVIADVVEYIDLVPPESLPSRHVVPPALGTNSKIAITLQRSGCFGTCPSYKVVVGQDGIVFEGGGFVVAAGRHTAKIGPDKTRKLAKDFLAADFYSLNSEYRASVTDNPTYLLSIDIDGHSKSVTDYVGQWVGMPAVVVDLENEVDDVAETKRWVEGDNGLVQALQAEHYDFRTFDAQVLLKEAASRGKTDLVHRLLEAGVPLQRLPAPKPAQPYLAVPFEHVGWLNAASHYSDTLRVLINAGASREDQTDKDLALAGAAGSGSLMAIRELIAYGADPNADLSKLTVSETGAGVTMEGPGAGSVLIYAAESGKPNVVREILRYHPKLEARDRQGRTAIFAAGDYRLSDNDGDRVQCVRLLAEAGADVNARDNNGDTPLHEIFLTDVEEELLKLGADVNARNNDGETPIFTNVDNDAIPLFIRYGADLNIRNNEGKTLMESAKALGPDRKRALQEALKNAGR